MLEGGYHFILDIEGCNPKLLDSPRAMLRLCCDLAKQQGARVLRKSVCKFNPSGVTAFVVIAESHISVHTWPESGKAFLDIFTCKEHFDADRALDFILGKIGGKRGRATLILRSSLLSRSVAHQVLVTDTTIYGVQTNCIKVDFISSLVHFATRQQLYAYELSIGWYRVS